MNDPIVIIGLGEIGGVFARAFLKLGHPVSPVTRALDLNTAARRMPDPLLVLVTVAEADLPGVLKSMPAAWRGRLGLVQNELLPRDWQTHGIEHPTVVSVWFEKKKGQDYKVLVPSPVYGPTAKVLVDALAAIEIPAWKLASEQELLFELVRKNLYILTTNIAGLVVGGTVQELWKKHEPLARAVADDVMALQFALIGRELDRDALIEGMLAGFEGDPDHKCMGRTAPARLARALEHADALGVEVPKLREIAARVQKTGG
jgi:ketopantoate reductase